MNTRNNTVIANKVVEWCCDYFDLDAIVKVKVGKYSDFDCWGTCSEGTKGNHYTIEVAKDQSLRGFVATVVHEMIHVKQWETGRWLGDGESECDNRQYNIADKIWKENII